MLVPPTFHTLTPLGPKLPSLNRSVKVPKRLVLSVGGVRLPPTESVLDTYMFVLVALPSVTVPALRFVLKRFVLDAVVLNKLVVVALPRLTLPAEVRLAAVKVVPSKVRLAESVNAPAVVMYGTRLAVSDETVRLVVDAVPKYPVPETELAVELAYGNTLAAVAVEVVAPEVLSAAAAMVPVRIGDAESTMLPVPVTALESVTPP